MSYFKDDTVLRKTPLAPSKPIGHPGTGINAAIAKCYNRIGGLVSKTAKSAGGMEAATALAVWYVESAGVEFVPGRAIIRFENHRFFQNWGKGEPKTFDQYFRFGGRAGVPGNAWENHQWRDDPALGFESFHGSQQKEYWVLVFAVALAAQERAYRSASIGGPQIMMDEHGKLGYASAIAMYQAFQENERWQILGFFDFCARKPAPGEGDLLDYMKDKDWRKIAKYYNGTGQIDDYAAKFERAYGVAVNLGVR